MEVRTLTANDQDAYSEFVCNGERNLIYATLEYRDFLSAIIPGEPVYLLAVDGARIVGSLPYFQLAISGEGTVINSLPWYGSHGACTLADESAGSVRTALLRRYVECASAPGVLSATMILSPDEEAWRGQYEEVLEPCVRDMRIGQISELPPDGPELGRRLEMALSQKTRNLVRKSFKQGFSITVADEEWAWRFLGDTHLTNMRALGGRPKPWEHFLAMRTLFPDRMRRLWVACLSGKPVAALLLLYFNRTVEYFVPTVTQEARPLQPLSCLIFEAMTDAIRSGYRWWNWGGTWASQATLHHFKAGWGAKDRPYSYLVNSTPDGMVFLKRHQDRLPRVFPYYYTHPYEVNR